jgi:type I restriction enzyme S subunit
MCSEVKMLSGGTPSKNEPRFWDGDIPWVGSGELSQRRIHDTELRVTELGAENGTRLVPEKTVLVVVRGMSLAKEFRVSLTMRPVTFNQDLKAMKPSPKIDSVFLYYYLQSQRHAIRDSATEASHGTKKIESRILENWPLPVVEKAEQKRIASILSAYDDLIGNNRRRIQLLEQAACLLYKEWFVSLRFPGHGHTRMKDGLPAGWERRRVSELCETVGGGTPSTKVPDNWGGDIPWVVPSDITKNGCLVLLDTERKITEKGLRDSSAKMLPPDTILMTSRASVGFFALMDRPVCTNQGFISIIPHEVEMRMFLLFNLLSRVEEIRGNAKGATFPEISKGRFRDMTVVVPSRMLVGQFSEIASDVIRQLRTLMKSTSNLEKARDLLLPRLMSGELIS